MAEHQELVFEIRVPTAWPLKFRNKILEVVRKAIIYHLEHTDQHVILTINNIPTELRQNDQGIGYNFKIIEQIPRDSYKIDLILPAEIMMISGIEETSIPVETENLSFHSFDLIREMQAHREVTIAVPDISRILEINGITGNHIHHVIFRTTYSKITIMEISTVLDQFTFSADPTVLVQNVAEDAVDVICFDQMPAPAPRSCILDNWDLVLLVSAIGAIFLILTFSLFVRVGQMF